jgi:hypothetical protein
MPQYFGKHSVTRGARLTAPRLLTGDQVSLSSFLRQPDVRAAFRTEFIKPKRSMTATLLVKPLSKRYHTIGTAFDYLLRFYLERTVPHAKKRSWVAAAGLRALGRATDVVDVDTVEVSTEYENDEVATGHKLYLEALTKYTRYLKNGVVNTALLQGAIYLAQLDGVIRFGSADGLGTIYTEDLRELRALMKLLRPGLFPSHHRCLLNPTFGKASRAIGGADADLILDDMLIDIKVTQHLELSRDIYNQLMGYYVLHELSGLKDGRRKSRIHRLGVYFARHAHLEVFEVKDVVNPKTFPGFLRWFSERTTPRRRAVTRINRT